MPLLEDCLSSRDLYVFCASPCRDQWHPSSRRRPPQVFHNYAFDAHVLRRAGCHVAGLRADTWHLARLVDSSLASWEANVEVRPQKSREPPTAFSSATSEGESNALDSEMIEIALKVFGPIRNSPVF